MISSKQELIHSAWDIHQNHYSLKPIDFDVTFVSQMMANIFCPGPSYFYILDFNDREFSYVSPTVKDVLGVEPDNFTLNNLLSLAHPDDLPHIAKCEEKVMDFLFNKISPDKITKYKFSYMTRIRRVDGSYFLLLHQAIAVSSDGFGRMSKVFCVHTNIDHLMPMSNYRLSIIGIDKEPSYLAIDVSQDTDDYLDRPKQSFTPRELEVIRQFAEGHTAEQVGQNLHISVGTVRTHRKNVLKKSGCNNMTALVARCIREGVI